LKTLVIYTHPNHDSLCGAFLEKVLQGLDENAKELDYEVLDLYKEGFDPVLVFNKEKRRRDMHIDPNLEKYRQQILSADRLVLVYPIWWGRPPAMLLGYVDQMFAANFAYKEEKGLFPQKLLKGRTAVCISTMKGPTKYPLLWLGNAHKKLMKRALFSFVGIQKVKFFEFGNMESPRGRQKEKLEQVYRYFRNGNS